MLVLANFGRAGDLRLPDGRRVDPASAHRSRRGSGIIVMGTDIPLDHRQLGRVARRAGVGLAWCGSFWGNGSGDIALAFTTPTACRTRPMDLIEYRILAESRIDRLFQAAAEGTQEAVLDALAAAETMAGRLAYRRVGLGEALGRHGSAGRVLAGDGVSRAALSPTRAASVMASARVLRGSALRRWSRR